MIFINMKRVADLSSVFASGNLYYAIFLRTPRDEIIHINKMFFAKKNKE